MDKKIIVYFSRDDLGPVVATMERLRPPGTPMVRSLRSFSVLRFFVF